MLPHTSFLHERRLFSTVEDCLEGYAVQIPKKLRHQSESECECRICKISQSFVLPSRRKVKKSSTPPTITLCSKCLSAIGKGLSHTPNSCKSKRALLLNAMELIKSQSGDEKLNEKIAASVVKAKVSSSTGTSIKLTTGVPKPLKVESGSPITMEPSPLTLEDVIRIQTEASLSDRQMLILLKNLRLKYGRNQSGSNKSKAKEFFSCINSPIIKSDVNDNDIVLMLRMSTAGSSSSTWHCKFVDE